MAFFVVSLRHPKERKRQTMTKATMMNRNMSSSAQVSCAASVCSENNSIIIILDAILASIFALISLFSLRLLTLIPFRSMTIRHMAQHFSPAA